jgi:pilus assembly protein CpaB
METRHLELLAAVTAIAAVLFGYLAFQFGSRSEPVEVVSVVEREVIPRDWTQVVVAIKPLPRGQTIAADAILLVPVQIVPPDGFLNLADVVGRSPTMDVGLGEPLTSRHFYQGSELVRSLGEGERAMAIEVNEAIGVGGFLEPGDYVDVLLYLSADRQQQRQSRARIVLPRQRLLAYGAKAEFEDAMARTQRSTASAARTAVLAVSASDAPKLLLASNAGALHLALHGLEPGESAESMPITLSELEALSRPAPPRVVRDVTTIWRGSDKSRVVH